MNESYAIVEDREGHRPRVLVEVDGSYEAELLVNDLRRRHHRVHLVRAVRGQAEESRDDRS